MISYDQALAFVLEKAKPIGVEKSDLNNAFSRVLAQDLVSPFPLPRFDNSAVDGYALGQPGSAEVWRVVRTISAGDPSGPPLGVEECARIFTGASVPSETLTVVMQEDVEILGNSSIQAKLHRGKNIRRAGEEVEKGSVALHAGTPLNAAGIGAAATLGLESVPVYRAPSVGILVTGAELTAPGSKLTEGQIYESNQAVLAALLRSSGITPKLAQVIDDSPEQTENSIRAALENCDLVITTGGISVGDRDIVKSTLQNIGVEEVFWKVAIKPGKPVYMGCLGSKTVFGLPGNPLSVFAVYVLLVKPYLRSVMGFANPGPDRIRAALSKSVSHKLGRREFIPAVIESRGSEMAVTPIVGQGSHMLTGMARANAFVDIPADVEEICENEQVSVVLP